MSAKLVHMQDVDLVQSCFLKTIRYSAIYMELTT